MNAPYEWDVNEPVARVFGINDEKLALVRKGDLSSPHLFTNRHRLVGEMMEQLVHQNKVAENTMRRAKEVFGDTGAMELLMIHGIYCLLAKTMQSVEIDYDPPIPGLLDQLKRYNAGAIEKEKSFKD